MGVPQVQMVEKIVHVPELQTVEKILEVPQIQIVEVEKEVKLPATTVTGSSVSAYNPPQTYNQPAYAEPVVTSVMATANPTVMTSGASGTATSGMLYRMFGQLTGNNTAMTYQTTTSQQ